MEVVVQCGRKEQKERVERMRMRMREGEKLGLGGGKVSREREEKKKRPTDMLMRRDVDDSTTISASRDANLTQLWWFSSDVIVLGR